VVGTTSADWEAFLTGCQRPGAGATADLKAFTLEIADAYFKNVREEFKAAAPNKLYMGCRFAGRGPEFAVRVAARHCDLVSYNIYARHLDDFKLPEGVDRPIIIGEFSFGALDRGLFYSGVQKASQLERAESYAVYVESALRHPQFVGTHWFQYSDMAVTGRFDGANAQLGLTDVCDRPYAETIAKVREVGYNMYKIRSE